MIVLAVVGTLLGCVALLAVIDLLRIRSDLQHGRATIAALDFATVDQNGGLVNVADAARADLHEASDRAQHSPWLSLLSHVPLVSDQVDAVRELTTAAEHVGNLGSSVASDVQDALDRAATAGPPGRTELIDAVTAQLGRFRSGLDNTRIDRGGWVLPPLAGARSDLVHQLDKAQERLRDGEASLATLRDFLTGPRRYLILGGNNAEMRSMGIATTSGVATIHDGSIDVSDFLSNGLTAVEKPGVPVPEGWDWLYGYLDPQIAYANMVCSPNFPLTGETAAALSAHNVHGAVDGVIYVDTVALQGVLSVIGPVTVDGVTYDGENAARVLVNENYFRFSAPDQTERRDAQGRVARAIFDALNTRDVSLLKVAATFQDLARSRHLAAWSSRPQEQQLWSDIGADGAHSENDLLVTSQDLGGSKLDYYVTERVAMSVSASGEDRRVDLSISLTNPRRPPQPYIDGGTIYAEPGEYGAYVVVFAPRDSFDFVYDDPPYTSSATDGSFNVTTFTTRVPRGTSKTVHLSFSLPAADTSMTVVPSARLAPAAWTFGSRSFDDAFPTELDIGAIRTGALAEPPTWALTGLLLFGVGAAVAGDAWGREPTRRSKLHATFGWWILMFGLAMLAVQVAIYVTAL